MNPYPDPQGELSNLCNYKLYLRSGEVFTSCYRVNGVWYSGIESDPEDVLITEEDIIGWEALI